MTRSDSPVKSAAETAEVPALKRGTATRIARKLGLSVHHVNEVAKGLRDKASAELLREIQRERSKQAREAKRKLARLGEHASDAQAAEDLEGAAPQKRSA